MRRVALVAVVIGLAVTAAPVFAAPAACNVGPATVDGVQVFVWCGPAKAAVRFGGRTVTFTSGMCNNISKLFAINVGKSTVKGKPRFKYFGITANPAPRDGTYRYRKGKVVVGGGFTLPRKAHRFDPPGSRSRSRAGGSVERSRVGWRTGPP